MSTKKKNAGLKKSSSPESESLSQSDGYLSSDYDSEYEELVSRGQELHPLVRFRRIRSTKRAELSYHYNPDVPKNKEADMIPLWQAAKKTVDGGYMDLSLIIREKNAQQDPGEEQLIRKLEVVLEDIKGQSKTFEELIKKRQEQINDLKNNEAVLNNQKMDKGKLLTNGDATSKERENICKTKESVTPPEKPKIKTPEDTIVIKSIIIMGDSKQNKTNGNAERGPESSKKKMDEVRNEEKSGNIRGKVENACNKPSSLGISSFKSAQSDTKEKDVKKIKPAKSDTEEKKVKKVKTEVKGKVENSRSVSSFKSPKSDAKEKEVKNVKLENGIDRIQEEHSKKTFILGSENIDRLNHLFSNFYKKYNKMTADNCSEMKINISEDYFMEFMGEFFTLWDASKEVEAYDNNIIDGATLRSHDIEEKFNYTLARFAALKRDEKHYKKFLFMVKAVLESMAQADPNFPAHFLQLPWFMELTDFVKEDYMNQLSHLSFKENSKKGRSRLEKTFICKNQCNDCFNATDSASALIPCQLKTTAWVGVMLQHAFISCVKDADAAVRERTIVTFSKLIQHQKESEGVSDIRRMAEMSPDDWQAIFFKMRSDSFIQLHNRVHDALLLLKLALCCALKIDEWLVDETLFAAVKGEINCFDNNTKDLLFGMDGFFGYFQAYAHFVIYAFEENKTILAGSMTKLNIGANVPMSKLIKYGSGDKYPWMDSLLYNFGHIYKSVWINQKTVNKKETILPKEGKIRTFDYVHGKYNKLTFIPPQLPYRKVTSSMTCTNCGHMIKKSSIFYSIPFQMEQDEDKYPREVPKIDRPEKVSMKGHVGLEDMEKYKRTIAIVCSLKCQLAIESCKSPELAKLLNKINSTFLDDLFEKIRCAKNGVIRRDIKDTRLSKGDILHEVNQCQELIEGIHQENLKILTKKFVPAHLLIIEEEEIKLMNKNLNGIKEVSYLPSEDIPKEKEIVPLGKNNYVSSKNANCLNKEMKEYLEKLLVHKFEDPSVDCYHVSIWEGVLNYHSIEYLSETNSTKQGLNVGCISISSSIQACELLDIHVLEAERKKSKEELRTILFGPKAFNHDSLDLYPFNIGHIQAEFIRKSCHKLVFKGSTKKDRKALKSMFKFSNALLGIWSLNIQEKECHGVILCYDKEKDVVFGFAPNDDGEFWNLLTEGGPTKYNIVEDAAKYLREGQDIKERKLMVENLAIANGISVEEVAKYADGLTAEPSEDEKDEKFDMKHIYNYMRINFNKKPLSYYVRSALMVFVAKVANKVIQESAKCGKGDSECAKNDSSCGKDDKNCSTNPLQQRTAERAANKSGLVNCETNHLRECPHVIQWRGGFKYYTFKTPKHIKISDPVLSLSTALAFECKKIFKGQDFSPLDSQFWSLWPRHLLGIVLSVEKINSLVDDNVLLFRHTSIVLEVGTIEPEFVEVLKTPGFRCFAILSENYKNEAIIMIEYSDSAKGLVCTVVRGKIMGKLYKLIKCGCYNQDKDTAETLFGETGTKFGCGYEDWTFKPNKGSEGKLFTVYTATSYTSKSLGKALWAGQLRAYFIVENDLKGLDQDKLYSQLCKENMQAAVALFGEEDTGSIRNCAVRECNEHQMYTPRAVITGNFPDEVIKNTLFGNQYDGNTIVALNVEKSLINQVVDTDKIHKKSYYFNIHVHDDYYFVEKEMKDNKHYMIAFTGMPEKNLETCFYKKPPTDERMLIIRYEPREGVLVAYYLKEQSKRNQVLALLRRPQLLLYWHEEKFKKIVEIDSLLEHSVGKSAVGNCCKCGQATEDGVEVLVPKTTKNLGARPKTEQKESKGDVSPEKEKESKSSSKDETHICWCCGKEPEEGIKLSKCGGCRKAWYCSEFCQTSDWEEHGSYCMKMQEKLAKKKKAKKKE